tara:strand:+ start:2548 stop:3396 length:849 start_codon:yes stop_codon:yes gene_type:complete
MAKSRIKNILEHDNPLKFLFSRFLIRTKLCNLIIIKQKNYNLKFHPLPFLGNLWINPNYKHTANIFFSDYLKSGDNVIDTGANVGAVVLECANAIGSTGKIYAIEPHPLIFSFLQENIKLNNLKNSIVFNCALGNKEGFAFLTNKRSDDQNAITNENGIKVSIKKIDDLEIHESKINLIVLDAIGYEKFIIEGGSKIFRNSDCVHFPIIEKFFQNYGYSYNEVFKKLEEFGFQIYEFSTEKTIKLITKNYQPNENNEITDLLAIRNLSDFLDRTKYTLINSN